MPKWAKDEPITFPGDEFYLSAFWELSTCRPIGWSAGPIPWGVIIEYARFAKLDAEVLPMFVLIIRAMDTAWMKWIGKKKPSNG